MFTGELVGAGNYTKISKVAPEYKYLDDVFNELFVKIQMIDCIQLTQ